MIDLLPYEVKLNIYLDELNIKAHNLLNERLNPNNTREEWYRLLDKYDDVERKRQWVLIELERLKEETK